MRPLPELTPENEFFWTSGSSGVLRMQRCGDCSQLNHPPQPACRRCGGTLAIDSLSGRGTIVGFTVNHQQWLPDLPPPYVVALVARKEQTPMEPRIVRKPVCHVVGMSLSLTLRAIRQRAIAFKDRKRARCRGDIRKTSCDTHFKMGRTLAESA